MNVTDETLMAYADGELDAAARLELDAAVRADPSLAERVARHRDLRATIHGAFAADLSEPVPEALVRAARGAVGVTQLGNARRRRDARPAASLPRPPAWMALAASVVFGMVVGALGMRQWRGAQLELTATGVVARGALAEALSNQLASRQTAQTPVRIGLTFMARTGAYCRTFALADGAGGLACRADEAWQVQVVARGTQPAAAGGFRPASTDLSGAVLTAVEEQISGEPLDAAAEIAARDAHWRGK